MKISDPMGIWKLAKLYSHWPSFSQRRKWRIKLEICRTEANLGPYLLAAAASSQSNDYQSVQHPEANAYAKIYFPNGKLI